MINNLAHERFGLCAINLANGENEIMNRTNNFFPYNAADLADLLGRVAPAITQVTSAKYPPHNIIQCGDSSVVVELAVAGFTRAELTVNVEDQVLTVTGAKTLDGEKAGIDYIHKGIATRPFTFTTRMAEGAKVKSATIVDGILQIIVALEVKERKSTTIDIN